MMDLRITHDPDGAPRLVDREGFVSISHDGEWHAVALSHAPVGIDLCLRRYAERTATVLRWLHIEPRDSVAQFAALEAVLKLRRLGIERLLARDVAIHESDRDLIVSGIGDDVRVQLHQYPDFVVAVCG